MKLFDPFTTNIGKLFFLKIKNAKLSRNGTWTRDTSVGVPTVNTNTGNFSGSFKLHVIDNTFMDQIVFGRLGGITNKG